MDADGDAQISRAFWTLTVLMAELKGAA